MPPEELHTATAGTEPRPDATGRRRRIALVAGIAVVTVVATSALVIAATTHDDAGPSPTHVASVAKDTTPPVAVGAEHLGFASSSSTIFVGGNVPYSAPPPAPTVGAGTTAPSVARPPVLPGAPAASRPGLPRVSVGAPAPDGSCAASWTVDDGGSPLVDYLVSHESAPVPPHDGANIGTAVSLEKTLATTATITPGGTLQVTAENALGAGPATDLIHCG